MTIAWSATCLNAAYDPSANPALTGTPLTLTARSVRGIPTRKTLPACSWPDLPSVCSTAFQSGSAAGESPGEAAATSPDATIARFNIWDLMVMVSLFISRAADAAAARCPSACSPSPPAVIVLPVADDEFLREPFSVFGSQDSGLITRCHSPHAAGPCSSRSSTEHGFSVGSHEPPAAALES